MKISTLNICIMLLWYTLVLSPYLSALLFLPVIIYESYMKKDSMRNKKLDKHYLIKAMPSIVFSKKLFKDVVAQGQECIICLDEFKDGEDYVTPMACDARHVFHSNCIQEWLGNKQNCPLCKK